MSLTSTEAGGAQVVTVNAQRIDAAMAIQFKEDMRTETEAGPEREPHRRGGELVRGIVSLASSLQIYRQLRETLRTNSKCVSI